MALDPFAQLVPDRAQPEFGLERLECGFQFSQSPVSTNRLLNAPLRVAGAQDIMARSGIVRIIRRIALPGNGPGLAVRRLRDGDVIVVVNCTYLALGLQSSGIFARINCVYPGCQTHINCERNQIICDAIAIIRPGSH